MNLNKINISSVNKYFKEGDVIISDGGKAKIRIKEILEHGIRFQSMTTPSYKGLLRYDKLNVVFLIFSSDLTVQTHVERIDAEYGDIRSVCLPKHPASRVRRTNSQNNALDQYIPC